MDSTENDAEGNAKQVAVPKGYTASQIDGETTVSGGFVIYEGDIDWSKIIIESTESEETNTTQTEMEEKETDDNTAEPVLEEEPTAVDNLETNNASITENNVTTANETAEETAIDDEIEEQEDSTEDEEADEEPTAEEQTRSNIFELQSTVNQYVWVPVEDITEIYGVDSQGNIWGKLYDFTSSGRSNLNWTETNGIMTVTSQTRYREPGVLQSLTSYDNELNLQSYMAGKTRYELLEEMQQNYYEMLKSVKEYGGFYIGRYETGGLSETAVVQKMNTDIASQTWYTMYNKCKQLSGSNDNVKTSMIWGSLWDATLEWLVDSGATNSSGTQLTYSLVGANSTTWGNYLNATFEYIPSGGDGTITTTKAVSTSTRVPTGSADYTKANNIYDLAGNVWDRTLEAYSTNGRVLRGGSYSNNGSSSADYRYYSFYPTYSSTLPRLSSNTFNLIGILKH